jgi:hypothetical protein
VLHQALGLLSDAQPVLTVVMLRDTVAALTADPRSVMLHDLGPCDVTLLVAMAVMERTLELSCYNIDNAYKLYVRRLRTTTTSGTKPVSVRGVSCTRSLVAAATWSTPCNHPQSRLHTGGEECCHRL